MEKTVSSKKIFTGKVIQLRIDEVELSNGHHSVREIVEHPGATAVIAITDDKKCILVKQYRKPIERETYEIPAGKLEEGERPADCALRELKEETGYTCERLERLLTFYTSPGFSDEVMHLFLATGLHKGKAEPDGDELVDTFEIDLRTARKMVSSGEIVDAKTIIGIFTALERIERGS